MFICKAKKGLPIGKYLLFEPPQMFSFELKKTAKDCKARLGSFKTAHGEVQTPIFMPVGTQGTVKAMTPEELKSVGSEIILGNTYHLSLRPSHETIKKLGGLHKFMHWDGPILTDSGGFQIFSLGRGPDKKGVKQIGGAPREAASEVGVDNAFVKPEVDESSLIFSKVTEEGVRFRTPIDGGRDHFMTPESAIEIQEALGSDIMMVLDECLPHGENEKRTAESMGLSLRWAARCLAARKSDNALFGIVQGGMFKNLRSNYISELIAISNEAQKKGVRPFDGYSIGGLSVGEPNELMYDITDHCTGLLPQDKPRYLMGVGTPEDLVECIERGVDMFDCVMPTRNARTAKIMTWKGDLNVKNTCYREDPNPPDADCRCYTCRNFSMAYLRHMFACNEILGSRLATIHNLHFYLDLIREIRSAIERDAYLDFKRNFSKRRKQCSI